MLYITLRQIEYVVAVARERSLSGAATRLNISQPSLSTALSTVEDRLGQRLFQRKKGSATTLTAAGEAYVDKAEQLLSLARRLEDPERYEQILRGRLTLGVFDDLAPFHLGPLLDVLAGALPEVEVQHRIGNFEMLARDMLDSRIDIAVTYDLGFDGSFVRRPVASVKPRALIARSDPLANRGELGLVDIADRPLVLFEEGLSIRHMLGLFRKIGARPRVAHRVRSLELMRSLAARGAGIGISYNTPPSNLSYDRRPVASITISDQFAAESVVAVRTALREDDEYCTAAEAIIAQHFRHMSRI